MEPRKAAVRRLSTFIGLVAGFLLYFSSSSAFPACPDLSDLAMLRSVMDRIIKETSAKHHASGTVFVLVNPDGVIFQKGYGLADREHGVPADPQSTVFRLGSLSKLFVAFGLMQLVESRALSLDDDVNSVLPYASRPGSWDSPVLVRHLLTHSAGFDSRYINILGRSPEKFRDLGKYLAVNMPPRVEAPGSVVHYSNFGASLAGLLLEKISGTSCENYIEENVFRRCGMKNAHYVPDDCNEPGLAVGYGFCASGFVPLTRHFIPVTPAGGTSATAADMARFLTVCLNAGVTGDGIVLKKVTLERMTRHQFGNFPGFPGVGFGFLEYYKNGLRLVGHGGGVLGYSSMLYLIPEKKLGYFIATNTNSAFHYLCSIEEAFLDFYFPGNNPSPPTVDRPNPARTREKLLTGSHPRTDDASTGHIRLSMMKSPGDLAGRRTSGSRDLLRFTGRYRGNRYPHSTFDKLLAIVLPVIPEQRISLVGANTLLLDNVKFFFLSSQPTALERVGPLLFRRGDGRGYVAFRTGEDGSISHMFFSRSPLATFDAVPWYDRQLFHFCLLALFVLIFVYGIYLSRIVVSIPLSARLLMLAVCVSDILGLAAPFVAVFPLEWEAPALTFGVPWYSRPFLALPFLSVILTPLLAVLTLFSVKPGPRAATAFILVSLAALAFLPYMYYWNLFHWM